MSQRDNLTQRLARVAPQIRPAGTSSSGVHEPSVGDLLSSYHPEACTTPPHIKSFQHRGAELGQPTRPWKVNDDLSTQSSNRFAATGSRRKTADTMRTTQFGSQGTAEMDACVRPGLFTSKETAVIDEQRERVYASNVKRPLGHAPTPGYPIVVSAKGFGISEHDDDSTQQLMRVWKDAEPLHAPGEQLDRHYDWASKGIDPAQHRFGVVQPKAEEFTMTSVLARPAETQITRKMVADYTSTVTTDVGQPRSYGFDDPAEWPRNAVHGIPSQAHGNSAMDGDERESVGAGACDDGVRSVKGCRGSTEGVRELLSSWAAPSVSLTSSTTQNACHDRRSEKGDSRHLTECVPRTPPTHQRTEMSAHVTHVDRRGRAIRTMDKLGDDIIAGQLLQPCLYVEKGIDCKYFAGGRGLEEVRALCNRCDFGLSDNQIDEVFAENARDGKCGIELFKNAARRKGYM